MNKVAKSKHGKILKERGVFGAFVKPKRRKLIIPFLNSLPEYTIHHTKKWKDIYVRTMCKKTRSLSTALNPR